MQSLLWRQELLMLFNYLYYNYTYSLTWRVFNYYKVGTSNIILLNLSYYTACFVFIVIRKKKIVNDKKKFPGIPQYFKLIMNNNCFLTIYNIFSNMQKNTFS